MGKALGADMPQPMVHATLEGPVKVVGSEKFIVCLPRKNKTDKKGSLRLDKMALRVAEVVSQTCSEFLPETMNGIVRLPCRKKHEIIKEVVVDHERAGYCYLEYFEEGPARESAKERFGPYPKFSSLPRKIQRSMMVETAGSVTHASKEGKLKPQSWQRIGGYANVLGHKIPAKDSRLLWYGQWRDACLVRRLAALRECVTDVDQDAIWKALNRMGVFRRDMHPCNMYSYPDPAAMNAFGKFVHRQEFSKWLDETLDAEPSEFLRRVRERPAVFATMLSVTLLGGALGMAHLVCKLAFKVTLAGVLGLFRKIRLYEDKIEFLLRRISKSYGKSNMKSKVNNKSNSFNRYSSLIVEEANDVLLEIRKGLHSAGHAMKCHASDLTAVPRNRFEGVKEYLTAAYDTLSIYTEPPLRVVSRMNQWTARFGLKTRTKVKVAWAPLLPYRLPNKHSHARVRMPQTGAQVWVRSSYEEALDWHARMLASSMGSDPQDLISRTQIRREFNGNPYHDLHLGYVRKHNPLFDGVPEGMDGLEIASAEAIWQSMERYGPRDDPEHVLSEADKTAIANAMFWQNPGLYAHAQLLDYNWADHPRKIKKIIKNLDASAGIPLLHMGTKKRLWKEGYLHDAAQAGIDMLAQDIILPTVAHVFPKSYVVARHKIDPSVGGKYSNLRTILGVPIHIQVRGRIINGDVNDRRDPWGAPGKPGMPLTGSAFNRMYKAVENYKFHYSLDGTKYDSTVSRQIMSVSTKLRKLGYEWHPDYELIANTLDTMEQSLMEAHLVNLWARPKDPKRVMWKHGGLMTGHESVTEDNTETLQIVVIATLCKLWNMTPQQVLESMALENVGDDNFFHSNVPLDEEAFRKEAHAISGVQFRIEDRSDKVTGVEFLSKTGFPLTPDEMSELESYGIDTSELKYGATHNRRTLLMRYSGLKQDGMHRAKARSKDPFIRNAYMLERINGYALLCAHHKDIHQFLEGEREWYLSRITNEEIKRRLIRTKRLKFPTYRKVMQGWYAPIEMPKTVKGLAPVWLAYYDTYNMGFYNIDSNLRKIRSSIGKLDPEFWDLPDLVLDELPYKPRGWKPTFQVESFIYWRAMEFEWPRDEDGLHIKHAAFPRIRRESMVALARQSPFFGCTDVDLFSQIYIPRYEKMLYNEHAYDTVIEMATKWRFRMAIMSVIYSGLSLSVSVIPAGAFSIMPLLFDLYYGSLRRLYSWLSYAFWLDRGRGSPIISNMVPKDQYGAYKNMAALLLSKIPESFYLPDLLYFLNVDTGIALETLAQGVNYVLGMATPGIHSIKNAVSETGLTGDVWETLTPLVFKELIEHKAIILDAPTGTGKTYFFPQHSLRQASLQLSYHIVLVPTRILWQETHIPGVMKSSRLVPFRPIPGVHLMTYGYAKAIWGRLSSILLTTGKEQVLFQLDELHFETPEQLWINSKVRSAGFWRVVSTATPAFKILRETFHTYHAPLNRKHTIWHIGMKEDVNQSALAHAMLTNETATSLGLNKRLLIIAPSEMRCDVICETLKLAKNSYPQPFTINVVSRSRPRVPPDGHVVITQMGRAGITIHGITCVIGSHEMVNHYGTVQHRPLSYEGMIQEKGRTGRTNNGIYIQSTCRLSTSTAVQVPDPLDALENIDLYNAEGKYGFKTPLIKIPPGYLGSPLNEWLAHERYLTFEQYRSLKLYLSIRHCYYGLPRDEAHRSSQQGYEALQHGLAPPYELEHIYVEEDLLRYEDIEHLLDGVHGITRNGKLHGFLNYNGPVITVGTLQKVTLPDEGKPQYKTQSIEQGVQALNEFIESIRPLTDDEIKATLISHEEPFPEYSRIVQSQDDEDIWLKDIRGSLH
jgi:hypothetical protein